MPRYSIGHQFISRGKRKDLCTVIDIHKTINSKGEEVKLRYVCTHDCLGQTVTDYDVVETTIKMSEINSKSSLDLKAIEEDADREMGDERGYS